MQPNHQQITAWRTCSLTTVRSYLREKSVTVAPKWYLIIFFNWGLRCWCCPGTDVVTWPKLSHFVPRKLTLRFMKMVCDKENESYPNKNILCYLFSCFQGELWIEFITISPRAENKVGMSREQNNSCMWFGFMCEKQLTILWITKNGQACILYHWAESVWKFCLLSLVAPCCYLYIQDMAAFLHLDPWHLNFSLLSETALHPGWRANAVN